MISYIPDLLQRVDVVYESSENDVIIKQRITNFWGIHLPNELGRLVVLAIHVAEIDGLKYGVRRPRAGLLGFFQRTDTFSFLNPTH
jgi:hypothetical protein